MANEIDFAVLNAPATRAAFAEAAVEAFLGPPTVAYLADYFRRMLAPPVRLVRLVPLPASVVAALHGWAVDGGEVWP